MNSVLLDTSFFIRLLNSEDNLHENAKAYFKYFLENGVVMKISTISIAEFCVKGAITDLPLKILKIIPFNINHAQKAGEFAKILFENRAKQNLEIQPRILIPSDTKLFAQADLDADVDAFVTSDARTQSLIDLLRNSANTRFSYVDIKTPYNQIFGVLL
jgi:predicted nucleic acid-binding protein